MTDQLDIQLLYGLENELKDNRLANVLYRLVSTGKLFTSSRADNASDLLKSVSAPIDVNSAWNTHSAVTVRDMRLIHFWLCNVKKYPGSLEDNKFYGISFSTSGNRPVNSVFLGSNGVGKTSIYAALEYAGMRKINTASLRGYHRKIGQAADASDSLDLDQKEFLVHFGKDFNDASVRLFSTSGVTKLDGVAIFENAGKPIVAEAFYCSEYDVKQLEENSDYTHFILKQLGLSYYYECLQRLYYLGVFVENDLRDRAKKEMQSIPTPYSDILYRLMVGVAMGNLNLDADAFYQDEAQIDKLFHDLNESKDILVVDPAIDELLCILKKELALLHVSNWHTYHVKRTYGKAIRELLHLKKAFHSGDIELIGILMSSLTDFLGFRKNLIDSVRSVNTRINSGLTSKERIDLIDDLFDLYYYHSYQLSGINYVPDKHIFESEVEQLIFQQEYSQLVSYLEDRMIQILESIFPSIKSTTEDLLHEYFDIDNDKIDISYYPKKIGNKYQSILEFNTDKYDAKDVHQFLKFEVVVLSSMGDLELPQENRKPISPRAYLNTFKFKLFCVALKLALCCAVKDISKVNYPFIIDDVFDSSDFDSRIKLKEFVKEMFDYHKSTLHDPANNMQLIFFTQDDLIADQVYKGIVEACGKANAKLSHIYDYHEWTEDDTVNFEFDDASYSYISVEDIIKQP